MSHGGEESTTKSDLGGGETRTQRVGADNFGRAVSKTAVAQICESVGFEGFKDSALDALADIAIRYLCDLGKSSSSYANLAGRTQCNFFDIVLGLEDLGNLKGFSGGSDSVKCSVSSGIVRELVEFVDSNEEVPFLQPIPQFPIVKSRKLIPSFSDMSEAPPGKHIPPWLPAFPDPHTYIRTPMWNERKSDPRSDKIEQARQRRKAEMALLSLQQRLVCSGGPGTSASGFLMNNEEGEEKCGGSEDNPFLAKPLQAAEKDVSPVVLPDKLKDVASDGNNVSVMKAFAPAIEAVKDSGLFDDGDGDRMSLPEKRPPIHFKFKTSKKFLGEPVDLSLQKKGGGRNALFSRDEEKDEKKRRAEYILRQSIENPQELTQL